MTSSSTLQQDSPRLDAVKLFEQTGRLLCTPEMLSHADHYEIPPKDLDAMQTAHAWVEQEICKVVHKREDLKEAVCPFARPAMDAQLLFYAVGKPSQADSRDAIIEEVRVFMDIFNRFEPKQPPTSLLRAIVLIFPDTPHDMILDAMDLKHSPIKTELLENDIQIGEFFRDCPFPATWDDTIFPLQSPIPFYAMRTFIESDWRFIHRIKAWREIYKKRFGEPPQGDQYKLPARLKGLLDKVTQKSKNLFDQKGP